MSRNGAGPFRLILEQSAKQCNKSLEFGTVFARVTLKSDIVHVNPGYPTEERRHSFTVIGMRAYGALVQEDIVQTKSDQSVPDKNYPFYRDLFHQTETCVLWLDADFIVRAATSAASNQFRCLPEELRGRVVEDLIGSQFFEMYFRHPFEVALAGKDSSFEFPFYTSAPVPDAEKASQTAECLTRWTTKPYQFEDGSSGVFCCFADISELYHSRLSLAKQTSQLDDFIDSSAEWFWETDSALRFIWISTNIEEIYGVKVESLLGKERVQISDDLEEAAKWREHTKLLSERKPFQNFEYKPKFNSTTEGWVRISGMPYFDDTGVFQGYRGTASDITEIKRLEDESQRVQQQLLLAMEHFPGGLILYDANDSILHTSKQCENIFKPLGIANLIGMTREAFLRVQANALWVPEARGREEEWVAEMVHARETLDTQKVVLRNNHWYQISCTDLPGGGWLQSLIDVTDERELEFKIAEERNLLRSIIDNISDKIYAKDLDGRFVVANEAVRNFFGAAEESDLVGTTDFDHYPEGRAAEFFSTEMQIIKEGHAQLGQVDLHYSRDDGKEIWLSTNKVPLQDTSGEIIGVVGCGRNITRQVELTAKLQESHQRFRDFAETAADWFWECDENLQISFLSERILEIAGHSGDNYLMQSLVEFVAAAQPDSTKFDEFKRKTEQRAAFVDLELIYEEVPSSQRLYLFSGKPLHEKDGKFVGYRGIARDITQEKWLRKQLKHQATHDSLTGLPNRQAFDSELDAELVQSRVSNERIVLGYIDLDQFKIVNDTAGHRAGDKLLCQVAQLLRSSLRDGDTLARLGGDEFGLILRGVSIEEGAIKAEQLIIELNEFRFFWDQRMFTIGASIGLVEITDNVEDTIEVLSNADLACYAAKDLGRNRVHIFSPEDDQLEKRHNEMLAAAGITDALENDRFYLYMQPIVATHSPELEAHHYEALLRMSDEHGNMVSPGTFIPAAERYGLMKRIDRWVIKNVLADFHAVFGEHSHCGVTINLSGDSMNDANLFAYVREHLELNKINPARVCFEITETAVINNFSLASEFISDMKELGCSFALDDFGSGLSSFSYLKHFKVDFLKIDGCFVRELLSDESDRAMVAAINQIGHVMGIKTIAEFVESHEILDVLRELKVDYVQGYGIGKPVPYEAANLQLKFAA